MERRNTLQRELVLSAVRELGCHADTETIYRAVSEKYPNISRATVYRNLGILAEDGEILRIGIPGSADRFDHQTHRHFHMRCVGCGRVFDVETEKMPELEGMIKDRGMEILSYDLIFRGICKECRENGK